MSGVERLRSGGILVRSLQLGMAFLIVIACSTLFSSLLPQPGKDGRDGKLHLLVPATSSNFDLCKLILSAQVLGYPTPVLINYGDPEADDPYRQHLAKVEGVLNYLDKQTTAANDEEHLVLVVDGYDLWFQLPPAVLVQRYYKLIKDADLDVSRRHGRNLDQTFEMRHKVIFSQDKICWPIDWSRPACWAAPRTAIPKYAYGPQTLDGREENNDPRWLNSGSILGPLNDMRDIFRDALQLIHDNHTTDSDQFYFAELFGLQEYERLRQRPFLLEQQKRMLQGTELRQMERESERFEPETSGRRTEYNILIDGTSALFQTLAFWKWHLTWMRANDSMALLAPTRTRLADHYSFQIPPELNNSVRPFAVLESWLDVGEDIVQRPWSSTVLQYNVATQQIPVLIHFTGEKRFREVWWKRMWFVEKAQELREAQTARNDPVIAQSIEGRRWTKASHQGRSDGSIENDKGGTLSWKHLCAPFEQKLYQSASIQEDEDFHPWSHF